MNTRMGVIYKITNKVNGHCYIGQTVKKIGYRWGEHKADAKRGSRSKLHGAIRKHGPNAFIVEVLFEAEVEKLNELEIEAIIRYDATSRQNYNQVPGGRGCGSGEKHWFYGKHHTTESKAKLSSRNKGRKHTAEARAAMSVAGLGKKKPAGFSETCRQVARRRYDSPEKLAKWTGENNPFFGRRHSPETLAKMAEKAKLRRHTPEVKEKLKAIREAKYAAMSPEEKAIHLGRQRAGIAAWWKANPDGNAFMRGRVITDEYRANCSQAARERWAKRKEAA